jgi:hypothetical protein
VHEESIWLAFSFMCLPAAVEILPRAILALGAEGMFPVNCPGYGLAPQNAVCHARDIMKGGSLGRKD